MSNLLEPRDLTFDETTLITRIKGGQTVLFGELISRYQDRIYNLAYRMSGIEEDAADLAQETFVKALKGINRFQFKSRFYTWLVRILINTTNDWRKEKARDQKGLENIKDFLAQSQAGNLVEKQNPESHLQQQERIDLLWQGIDMLDETQRQILLLREQETMSYQEIAQLLKISEGTVKSRLFRARESLRELLGHVLCNNSGEE